MFFRLEKHKIALQLKIRQMQQLVETVNNTVEYLKGKQKMDSNQLFKGFSKEQEEAYAREAETMYDPKIVRASNKKWQGYSEDEKARILNESKEIYLDMAAAIPAGAGSTQAQACVERWRKNMDYFWTPNLDQLVGLTQLYKRRSRFKANFDQIDPRLASFSGSRNALRFPKKLAV